MDAPGPHGVGDASELLDVVGVEQSRGSVDVVYVAAVDADGGEQAGVFLDRGEVLADVAGLEEDGTAGVTALDGAVGVVPLVDPADGEGGCLTNRRFWRRIVLRHVAQQRKSSIQRASFVTSRHDE